MASAGAYIPSMSKSVELRWRITRIRGNLPIALALCRRRMPARDQDRNLRVQDRRSGKPQAGRGDAGCMMGAELKPMSEFDPAQPAMVHDVLNDTTFQWKPDKHLERATGDLQSRTAQAWLRG